MGWQAGWSGSLKETGTWSVPKIRGSSARASEVCSNSRRIHRCQALFVFVLLFPAANTSKHPIDVALRYQDVRTRGETKSKVSHTATRAPALSSNLSPVRSKVV